MAVRAKDLSKKTKSSTTTNEVLILQNSATSKASQFPLDDVFPMLQDGGTTSGSKTLGSALGVSATTPLFLGGGFGSSITGTDKNTLIFKGIRSNDTVIEIKNETLSSDLTKGNIVLDFNQALLDLDTCSNTNSAFLSTVNLASNVGSTILPIANGGTGLSTTVAKGVVITHDSGGTNALATTAMSTSGSLLIGGSSGPAVRQLAAGTNMTITNGDGTITLASSIGTIAADLDMNNYDIDLGTGWLSGDGTHEGINIDSAGKVFIGESTPTAYFTSSLNIGGSVSLGNSTGSSAFGLTMKPCTSGSSPGLTVTGANASGTGNAGGLVTLTAGAGDTNGNGGGVVIQGGAGAGSGNGGDVLIKGGVDGGSGTDGSVAFYSAGVLRMQIGATGITTYQADLTIAGTTPTITIGDGGAEDTSLVFDGNAQDYYVGLDDTDDILKIGLGSAVGTTPAISVDSAVNTTFGGHAIITAATDGIVHTGSGTVTQATDHTNGVTINATSGVIQLAAVALNAATNAEFTVTNSTVQADSVIILTVQDENTTNNAQLTACTHTIAGGSFKISVHNPAATGATSTTASKIHFLIINNSV